MIRRTLVIIVLSFTLAFVAACDSAEQAFSVTNNSSQILIIQILEVNSPAYPNVTRNLPIAEQGQRYNSSMPLMPGRTYKIFTDGFSGGRVGYTIIINDDYKELFRRAFPRDELVRHKFRLTITEQGIEYSSQ
jgi:hypothetical protein